MAAPDPRLPAAFEGAHVFKMDGKADPAKMEDQDLLFAHSLTHAFNMHIDRSIVVKGWTAETLLVYHEKIVKEMLKRKIDVAPADDALGESILKLMPAGTTISKSDVPVVVSDDVAEDSLKVLNYMKKYSTASILSVLSIAEEAQMLKTLEAQDAQEEDVANTGRSEDG